MPAWRNGDFQLLWNQARFQNSCLTCMRSASNLPEAVLQVRMCWDRAIESAGGLDARQAAVAAFNRGSRFRKRGLALTPTKFGISFTTKFLNQVTPPRKAPSARQGCQQCCPCRQYDV